MEKIEDIAKGIGINVSFLYKVINNADKFYVSYYKKKKSGKDREIDAPSYQVKSIQAWILNNVLQEVPISLHATGFVRGKGQGIKRNASFHVENKHILCMDIKDFFPSINYKKVWDVYKALQLNDDICDKLAKISTYKERLPQGGVTSPCLSNIIFKNNDISELCSKLNITYSRYADDLAFSCDYYNKLNNLIKEITKIINKYGFNVNERKTRIYSGKDRKVVTGVILNSGRLTTGRKRKRILRAALHNLIVKKKEVMPINKMLGNYAFIRDIENDYADKFKAYILKLKSKKTTL